MIYRIDLTKLLAFPLLLTYTYTLHIPMSDRFEPYMNNPEQPHGLVVREYASCVGAVHLIPGHDRP